MIGVPQAMLIALITINASVHLAKLGERKRGRYNWVGALVRPASVLTLLWWGGFFGP